MQSRKVDRKNFLKEIGKMKNYRLVTITCLDEKYFTLYYHFEKKDKIFSLKISVLKRKPFVESIHKIFPSAELYEREIHDFFGVEFLGNPFLHEKLFLSDDWRKKPPLRK